MAIEITFRWTHKLTVLSLAAPAAGDHIEQISPRAVLFLISFEIVPELLDGD